MILMKIVLALTVFSASAAEPTSLVSRLRKEWSETKTALSVASKEYDDVKNFDVADFVKMFGNASCGIDTCSQEICGADLKALGIEKLDAKTACVQIFESHLARSVTSASCWAAVKTCPVVKQRTSLLRLKKRRDDLSGEQERLGKYLELAMKNPGATWEQVQAIADSPAK